MVDIATRVYNHTWKIDPIVRSVIDTDFYKLLMAQTIFRRHRDAAVTFGIKNRTARVRLAEIVDEGELREQLDHIRTLRLTRGEFDLAARQHLLRPPADVLAGLHGLAREVPLPRVPAREARRPIRAHLPRPLGRDHDVGDPGARGPERAALARRAQGHGPLRAAGALCPRHDARLGEDRPPEAAPRSCRSPISARGAGTASCGRTGACRR